MDWDGFPREFRARFEPIEWLGEGGTARVLRARDRELERFVAIKLHKGTSDPVVTERFLREARTLARLEHENLVRVFDAGAAGEIPYLVMECVEGQTARGLVPVEDPLPILLQVADALDVVHGAGLVHRDLKPSNIMVEDAGRAVLMDLGFVHDPTAETLTRSGAVLGTAGYVAPESLRGFYPEPSWDWFAWGVSLYHLVEARVPFSMEELYRFGGGEALPELELGPRWGDPARRELLMRCLSADPAARPGGAAEVRALLAGEGRGAIEVTASRPPPSRQLLAAPPPPARTPDRMAGPGAVRAAIACLLLAAFAWIGLGSREPPSSPPPAGATSLPPSASSPAPRPPGLRRDLGLPPLAVDVGAAIPALCVGEPGTVRARTSQLMALGGGEVLAQVGSGYWVVLAPGTGGVRALARRAAGRAAFPGGARGEVLFVHDPGQGELEITRWRPRDVPVPEGRCYPESSVVDVVPPAGEEGGGLARRLGPVTLFDPGGTAEDPSSRILLATAGAEPRVVRVFDRPGWRPVRDLATAWAGKLLLVHHHHGRGDRVSDVDPRTGQVGWRIHFPDRLQAAPAPDPAGLHVLTGGVLSHHSWEDLAKGRHEGRVVLDLRTLDGWLEPWQWTGRIVGGADGTLHVFLPHAIPPTREARDVPVLTWTVLVPGAGAVTHRLYLPRPPDAVFVEQPVRMSYLATGPDAGALFLQLGWSRYEVIRIDLARRELVERWDRATVGELGVDTYLRADPILADGVATWMDSLGNVLGWRL